MGIDNSAVVAIGGLFVVHFVRGFLGTKLSVDTNKVIDNKVRASVLSLRSLFVRLGSLGIVFISGYLLENYSFSITNNNPQTNGRWFGDY